MRAGLAKHRDYLIGAVLAGLSSLLYGLTLLPGIGAGDTAELQRVPATLALAHPTGYPLYVLLGWFWSHLPLGPDPAWRMNFFSAVLSGLALGTIYLTCRALGQRRLVAVGATLTLATSLTLWSQATRAEVWGLAALIQIGLVLSLLRWRANTLPLWAVGLVLGLGLAHHRTIIWSLPGLVLFIVLTRRPAWRSVMAALLAMAAVCLLYLYIPWRAPAGTDRWAVLWAQASGNIVSLWLHPRQLLATGGERLLTLAQQYIWPQLTVWGAVLALVGVARFAWRDRAVAVLLLPTYGAIVLFCAAYFVADVDVFLIPAHVIATLLLGQGVEWLLSLLPARFGRWAALAILVLPLLLVQVNLKQIQVANSTESEQLARAIMAQSFPAKSLVVGDWEVIESLHYLQAIEHQQPDMQLLVSFSPESDRQFLADELKRGRSIFLVRPRPELGLAQSPAGRLWQVSDQAPSHEVTQPLVVQWNDGIQLSGFSLQPGPYRAGEIVPLTVAWLAQSQPTIDYTLFMHVVDSHGETWGQHDRAPSEAPTSAWQPDSRYTDLYGAVLKPNTPPGRYIVKIGWYTYPSLQRLARTDPVPNPTELVLGEIEVIAANLTP